ncbi:conserved Plasmodium protein, unknown function [Plasmodium ovale wallikeri]|uniref:Uncharacterized protein n=2 Tax=Plasmodium ovale TaxID=36330 RepID=A0A1A8ZWF9_PLAOA|nr:conserved Plasmodium protein, unknown function [Plasmodium ovale wallikeri]SBT48914.1 conserved Plasmodium protein, unknown function [Plasmodium ovale wallikeri]SBT82484.1 conserved Plasmodium protein, unknown function [Plasmodium ovale]
MKIRLLVLTLMTVLSLSFAFSYRRIQNSNNLEGLQQCFRPVKQSNFHELRSRITATGTDPLNVEVGDWTIHITHKSPYYNKEKIKSILIYSMTFPFKELEEFKDYLFED